MSALAELPRQQDPHRRIARICRNPILFSEKRGAKIFADSRMSNSLLIGDHFKFDIDRASNLFAAKNKQIDLSALWGKSRSNVRRLFRAKLDCFSFME
jgi:hypothetical protein